MIKPIFLILLLLLVSCSGLNFSSQNNVEVNIPDSSSNMASNIVESQVPGKGGLLVGIWNLDLDDKKVSSAEFMSQALRILNQGYNLIIILGIKDSDGSAWFDLCSQSGFACRISGVKGDGSQIGLMNTKGSDVSNFVDVDRGVSFIFDSLNFVGGNFFQSQLMLDNSGMVDVVLGEGPCGWSVSGFDNSIQDKETMAFKTDNCRSIGLWVKKNVLSSGVYTDGINSMMVPSYLAWANLDNTADGGFGDESES